MLLAVIAAPFGPVAQLGAHYIRIVGVVGSNPIRSTKKTPPVWVVFFYFSLLFRRAFLACSTCWAEMVSVSW